MAGATVDAMSIPWAEPLTPIEPGPRVVPEPPRRGEVGGEPCRVCEGRTTEAVWSDDHFTMHPPTGGSLPGTVWVASKEHADSFADLSPEVAAAFGPLAARIERAVLERGDVGPRPPLPLGRRRRALPRVVHAAPAGHARGVRCTMLPLWEDVLPNVPDDELLAAARGIAERLA